jgi:hypothetical protein
MNATDSDVSSTDETQQNQLLKKATDFMPSPEAEQKKASLKSAAKAKRAPSHMRTGKTKYQAKPKSKRVADRGRNESSSSESDDIQKVCPAAVSTYRCLLIY